MNRFPIWKYAVLLVCLAFGAIYAMPNLYKPDPAIQITSNSKLAEVDEKLLKATTTALTEAGIEYFGEQISEQGSAMLRFHTLKDQLVAKDVVKDELDSAKYRKANKRYVVALNQASNTPEWLSGLGASPMNLGLDLAGGVHFLLEVDTPSAVKDRMGDMKDSIRQAIRKERLHGVKVELEGSTFTIRAPSEEYQQTMVDFLKKNLPELLRRTSSEDGDFFVTAQMTDQTIQEIENHAVAQNLTTIRNRVNELGVSEPLVQRQGRNRIVVELPGVQDAAEAKKILGKTANLEFRLEAEPSTPITQKERFEFRDEREQAQRGSRWLERRRIITGEHVINAVPGFDDQSNSPKIDIKLNSEGGTLMHHATRNDVGRNLGVLFIDYYTEKVTRIVDGEEVEEEVQKIDKKIISLATIRDALGVQFQTTGLDSPKEASDLALLLRAGALAAPMVFVEERTIGPSLGAENIEMGKNSVYLGLILVLVFMLLYYKVFGFAANLALAMNIVLLVAIMSVLGATLTLPGIAGIVLTVGMAVDANVLIFSRIKEELKNGLPPQSAIHSGFERAFTTILDANLTTLIVAFILFAIGTGPIKGFAVTLSIGILTSMFTAIWGTRAVVNLMYGGRKITKVWI